MWMKCDLCDWVYQIHSGNEIRCPNCGTGYAQSRVTIIKRAIVRTLVALDCLLAKGTESS